MRRSARRSYLLLTCALYLLLQWGVVRAYASRDITPAQWRGLTSDKAFTYKNDVEKAPDVVDYKPGAFEKAIKAFFDFWKSGEGTTIMWILVIALVSWLVYKVFFQGDSFLFGKNKKAMGGAGEGTGGDEKDLATTNWEALLHQAADGRDYRLAIRYSYMRMLQLMQQRSLIQYRIDKTNYEYYNELNDTTYKQPFRQLSRQYEYAWYGRFDLSPATYSEYKELFDNVKKQLGA